MGVERWDIIGVQRYNYTAQSTTPTADRHTQRLGRLSSALGRVGHLEPLGVHAKLIEQGFRLVLVQVQEPFLLHHRHRRHPRAVRVQMRVMRLQMRAEQRSTTAGLASGGWVGTCV